MRHLAALPGESLPIAGDFKSCIILHKNAMRVMDKS
jgi:hypothetical protein